MPRIHETGLAVLLRTITDLLIRDRVGDPRVRTVADLTGSFPSSRDGKDQVTRQEAAITVGSTASASIRRPLAVNLPLMPRVHPNFIPRPVLGLKTGCARFEHPQRRNCDLIGATLPNLTGSSQDHRNETTLSV